MGSISSGYPFGRAIYKVSVAAALWLDFLHILPFGVLGNWVILLLLLLQVQEFSITGFVIGYPLELTGFQGKQVCVF